jgi:uncharacterized membrane protein YgcG
MTDSSSREDRIAKGCFTLIVYAVIALAFIGMWTGNRPDGGSSSRSTNLAWDTYNVTLDVREDGSIHVTEYQEIAFSGLFSAGFAEIPMERIESIDNISIALEAGVPRDAATSTSRTSEPQGEMVQAREVSWTAFDDEPNTFRAREEGGFYVIDYAFDPVSRFHYDFVNPTRTIVLEYDVHGVIRDYPDAEEPWQQFHWMAIAPETSSIAPIRESTVTINLPESVADEDLVVAPEPMTKTGDTITWKRQGIGDGNAFDVQAAFPTITGATAPEWQPAADARDTSLEQREARQNAGQLMLLLAGIGIAVIGGLTLLYAWYRSIREPQVGPVHDRLSEPPGDMPAILVGSLLDEQVDPRDIAAGVLDLDRQGVVTITEAPEGDPQRYYLTLNREIPARPAWARTMVQLIFGENARQETQVGFSALQSLFGHDRESMQQAIDQTLVDDGYYEELPAKSRKHWGWVTNGFAVVGAMAAVGILIWAWSWTLWAIIPLVVGFVMRWGAGKLTPHIAMKTRKGAEIAAQWRAFENHLTSGQFRELTPSWQNIRLEYQPWLVAFGIERGWLAEMNRPPWMATGRSPGGPPATPSGSQTATWIWGDSSSGPWRDKRRHTRADSRGSTSTPPSAPNWNAGGSWDPGSWGDMQSASNRVGGGLQSASSGMFEMMGDMLEALGSSSGGGGGSSSGSSFRGSSSRSGGGRSRSSSGGGRRGFR